MEGYDVYNKSGEKVGEIKPQPQPGGLGEGCCGVMLLVLIPSLLSFFAYANIIESGDTGDWVAVAMVWTTILVHSIYLCRRKKGLDGGYLQAMLCLVGSGSGAKIVADLIMMLVGFEFTGILDAAFVGVLLSIPPAIPIGYLVVELRKP